ncbi:MAG: family 1 glycosylhydrolase [Chthoniobacterales bacterium]|nr:family 1 glycosylhydrolase [Chthoniobacterales bacterium]
MNRVFPKQFTWGAATSACQIEGGVLAGGRTFSIWDHYCQWQPEKILNEDSCHEATDHFHRFSEDLDLLQQIGVNAYRFSISWSRIFPNFCPTVNSEGLDFYERLVDECLRRGIQPWVTLYHWDLPLWLHYRGGWLNPSAPELFQEFASAVAKRLGDRVIHWMTFNEPQCFIGKGLYEGEHAPFFRLPLRDALLAAMSVIRAHELATEAIRRCSASSSGVKVKIGFVTVGIVSVPATEGEADVAAAEEDTFLLGENPLWSASLYLDPIFLGRIPEELPQRFGNVLPDWIERMLPLTQCTDFLGLNLYTAKRVCAGKERGAMKVLSPPGSATTNIGWEVVPECMYWGPKFYYQRYKVPIIITENGMAAHDWPSVDGKVYDPQRVAFLREYLLQLSGCINDGVPVEGYFHWSLLDNFEWAMGYRMRFGLIYVDYSTQKRIPKESASFYRQIIATSGEVLF